MKKHYNKFLIISSIAILIGGVYAYFSHDLNAQAASSALSSSAQGGAQVNPLNISTNDKISQDTAFLTTLTSLNKLQINTSIFTDKAFTALVDNTVVLEEAIPGRSNPFAPIDTVKPATNTPIAPVTTEQPTQITSKSALLNGSVDSSSQGVTSTYFEYGLTDALGKSTPEAKQSLIGSYFANITDLKPHTTYFYSAVARINGSLNYGEIVSFTTK